MTYGIDLGGISGVIGTQAVVEIMEAPVMKIEEKLPTLLPIA